MGKLASGTIDGSYSAGQVSGTEGGVGGLLGENVSGVIISSYWDILTSGQTYSAGGDGRSTQQMIYPLAEDTFAGWDFQSVWALDPAHSTNNGYPFHRKVSQDPSDGGPLSVTIAPRNATAAGALWRVKGRGGWNASGHVVENLAPGEYIVEFKTAFGWIQPGDMTVQVGASPLSVTGTYSYLADLRTMVQFVESYYLNTYSDIRGAVQRRQLPSGWHHYVLSGRFENRRPNAFFDPDYYMNRYPDIGQAIRAGTYPGTAFDHFVASGLWEGRIPSAVFESFDARTYLAANPDLARHIPAHIGSAFFHYVMFGFNEGRNVGGPFFDEGYYLARYPDIRDAIATVEDFGTAYDHFMTSGLHEGRIPSATFAEFDPEAYLAANPDLRGHVGGSLGSELRHYLLWGVYEGRTSR